MSKLCTFCHEKYVENVVDICDECRLLIKKNDYIKIRKGIDVVTNDYFVVLELIFNRFSKEFLDITNISYIQDKDKFYIVVYSIENEPAKDQFRKIFKNFLEAFINMKNLDYEMIKEEKKIMLSYLNIDFHEDLKIEIKLSKMI